MDKVTSLHAEIDALDKLIEEITPQFEALQEKLRSLGFVKEALEESVSKQMEFPFVADISDTEAEPSEATESV